MVKTSQAEQGVMGAGQMVSSSVPEYQVVRMALACKRTWAESEPSF